MSANHQHASRPQSSAHYQANSTSTRSAVSGSREVLLADFTRRFQLCCQRCRVSPCERTFRQQRPGHG
eukprot:240796-Pyramimonas_sp.AAC.1